MPEPPRLSGAVALARRFKQYDKAIRDAWEAYWLIRGYLPKVKDLVKAQQLEPLELPSLGAANNSKSLSRDDTYGAITHTIDAVVPTRTLLAAVTETEAFLQDMVRRVLSDFPNKLRGSSGAPAEGEDVSKILDIILRSADRVEILDRIIEERVRGLFYGAPASFFVKPASKMEFGDTFSREFAQALQRYVEICARRNCIVHNKARSDRKYYREVGRADDGNLGKKLSFTGEYLRESMNTLRGMAAIACESVCINIYNSRPPAGAIVRRRTKAFRVQEGT